MLANQAVGGSETHILDAGSDGGNMIEEMDGLERQ